MESGESSTAFHKYSSPTRSTFSVIKPRLHAESRLSLMLTIRKKRSKHLKRGRNGGEGGRDWRNRSERKERGRERKGGREVR